MSYLERYIKWGKEPIFGSTPATYYAIQKATRFDALVQEHVEDEAIIAVARDAISRTVRNREITGTLEHDLVSGRFFEFILGSIATQSTDSHWLHTCTASGSAPSMTIERAVRSPTDIKRYTGVTIDSAEVRLEQGDKASCTLNWAAQNVTKSALSWSAPVMDLSTKSYVYWQGEVQKDSTVIVGIQSATFEVRNNLQAKWTPNLSLANPRLVREFRPGLLEVVGVLTLSESIDEYVGYVLNNTEFDINFYLSKSANENLMFNLQNAMLYEWRDELAGRDQYEGEFPFKCRADAAYNVISCLYENAESTPTLV